MTRIVTAALMMIALSVATSHTAQAQARTQRAGSAASSGAPVELNSATSAQLESLPGVGEAMAKRIIEYRQKSGGFKKVEDLMNVRGIGERSFLTLKSLVTVSQPRSDRAAAQ